MSRNLFGLTMCDEAWSFMIRNKTSHQAEVFLFLFYFSLHFQLDGWRRWNDVLGQCDSQLHPAGDAYRTHEGGLDDQIQSRRQLAGQCVGRQDRQAMELLGRQIREEHHRAQAGDQRYLLVCPCVCSFSPLLPIQDDHNENEF